MKIQSGAHVDIAVLADGFNRGFQDYKYHMAFSPAQLTRYLDQCGINPADCAVLVDEAGRGCGIALLSVHGDGAWCGGLAVTPRQRRRGWARALMAAIQQRARAFCARTLWLEVLAENTAAQRLYESLGYQRERELFIWQYTPNVGQPSPASAPWQPMEPAQIVDTLHTWHAVPPYWRRTAPMLTQQLEGAVGRILVDPHGEPVAYVLYCEPQIDVGPNPLLRLIDLAARPSAQQARRDLLRTLQAAYPTARLSLLNEPESSPWNADFAACGFEIVERQYEMRLPLS